MNYQFGKSIKTRENILALLEKMGKALPMLTKKLKEKKIAGEFKAEQWEAYMLVLVEMTGNAKCPVCGGPQMNVHRDGGKLIQLDLSSLSCLLHPDHDYASAVARIWGPLQKKNEDEMLAMILGRRCTHDLYLLECDPCIEQAKKEAILANDKRYKATLVSA